MECKMENEDSLIQEMLSEEIRELMVDIIICVGALTRNAWTTSKIFKQTHYHISSLAPFAPKT
jgi:hypothetical protein